MSGDGLRQEIRLRMICDDGAPRRRDDAAKGSAGSSPGLRLHLCGALFLGVFAVLSARLAYVSFGMNEEVRVIRAETRSVPRPEVVDRNGRPLIMNRTARGLAIDGREVWDAGEVVASLVRLFPDIDAARLRDRLENKQYTLVLDSLGPEERQQVVALGLPGIKFPPTTHRAYPQKDLAAHVVGYTIPGRGGATGIERALDTIAAFEETARHRLSIDVVAQQVVEDELTRAMRRFDAKAAWGVLLDIETGEVRALASLPDYNPNRPGASADADRRNRAMSDVYELGSAFKAITLASAVDHGVVTLTDEFDVRTPVDVGGWEIDDYSFKKPVMTVSEILQYSSNIGTVHIVEKLGLEAFLETLKAVGLDDRLKTELPEAASPLLSRDWRPAELATSAYGHGIAVSPLQLTAAFAAVVNGGVYRVPTFIADAPREGRQVFADETSARMRIVLRRAVTDGTGGNAEAPGYYIIGKTATADKPGQGGYKDDGPLISSFIGAFPGYAPRYAMLLSLDEPKRIEDTGGYATAGHVAAPVFRRVVERIAPSLGIMPVGDDVAFDGFVGLRRDGVSAEDRKGGAELDALAALLSEAAY